ncbi:di- and tricarboxylate transporter [Actinobacillus equuli]|nr:di- and tricarboxylate transporter [Actinobacillus equuli]
MLIARRWLDNGDVQMPAKDDNSMSHLIQEYQLHGRAKMVILQEDSPFIGKTMDELKLRSLYRMNVIAIQRYKNFRSQIMAAFGNDQLQAKDIY